MAARPPRGPTSAVPAMSPAGQGLFVLAAGTLLAVSGGLLWTVGYNYDGLAGSGLTKIHPGTYLAVLAFGVAALGTGNPVAFAAESFRDRPGSAFLLLSAAAVFVDVAVRAGPGLAGLVDTYMLPALVAVLFALSDRPTRRRLEVVVHAAMVCNAVLGLVEFGTHTLVFPYRFDGLLNEQDGRPAGLQGHPLGNATITATYLLALVGGGGTLSRPARAGIVALEALALVAFGGRSSIVVTPVLAAVAALGALHRTMRSGRVSLLAAAAVVLVLTLVPIVGTGLAVGGFFDALLGRFASDGGSADARVSMLALFQGIPLGDLILGPDPALVDALRRTNGLEDGIENPVVRTVLYQGVLVTVLLAAAVAAFLRETARVSGRGLLLAVLGFVALINTFESLASKSTMLAKVALMLLVLFRPDRGSGSRPREGGRGVPAGSLTGRAAEVSADLGGGMDARPSEAGDADGRR